MGGDPSMTPVLNAAPVALVGSDGGNKSHSSKKSSFNPVVCSPKDQASVKNDFTCYTTKGLVKLKRLWNKRHPEHAITADSPQEIWLALRKNIGNVCENEACWLRQTFAKEGLDNELIHGTFAPQSPADWRKNPHEWLSSMDIQRVMNQYEQSYPSFVFIGPSPIDFDTRLEDGECVWNELCQFKLDKLIRRGKTKIGFVFNTDPHDKGGAHWISMFVDVVQRYIFFFDSTGFKPPKEVARLIDDVIIPQGAAMKPPIVFKKYVNTNEHQKKNTECGVYSLFMIVSILTGKMTVDQFMDPKHRLTDEEVSMYRRQFFNVDQDVRIGGKGDDDDDDEYSDG